MAKREYFKMEKNDLRKHLLKRVEKKIIPEIEKNSMSAGVTEAIEKGLDWYEKREEVMEEIEAEEKELEERKKKWEI